MGPTAHRNPNHLIEVFMPREQALSRFVTQVEANAHIEAVEELC
jgi:hypothetical protein